MKARSSVLKFRIACALIFLAGALILGPVNEKWPDSALAHGLTLLFAFTVVTSLFYLAITIVVRWISILRFLFALATRPFRKA